MTNYSLKVAIAAIGFAASVRRHAQNGPMRRVLFRQHRPGRAAVLQRGLTTSLNKSSKRNSL